MFKQYIGWRFTLVAVAVVIIVATIWFVNNLSEKIQHEETKNVATWVEANRKQNEKGKWDDVPVKSAAALSAAGGLRYFGLSVMAGFRYAGWVLLCSLVMGALYGLISGIIWQPAAFAVAFTTFFVILNFVVALPVFGVHMLKFVFIRKGRRGAVRYFALSLAFLLVFVAAYWLLMNTGVVSF